jgi:hypothetical protein
MEETEINVEVPAYNNVQSANHCFPSAIVSAPETRHLVTEYFRDFFSFYDSLRRVGLPANGEEPARRHGFVHFALPPTHHREDSVDPVEGRTFRMQRSGGNRNVLDKNQCCREPGYFGRQNRHEEDTTGWSVPMMPDGKSLGDITMDDSTCKMFNQGMNHLIEACIGNHTFGPRYAADWRECMDGYRQVRALLNSRTEFEFDDVCAFVIVSDAFMERYIALTGRDGMTNYFHMLHAGHIAYYLLKFKNLYRLSQQGWENINSVMKRSFHRGTQRGGGKKTSAKIRPVFFRVLRASLWRMGQMFGFLQHFGWVPNEKFVWRTWTRMQQLS